MGLNKSIVTFIAVLAFTSCIAREVPVINAPIMDTADLGQIVRRINQEGFNVSVNFGGVIMVRSERIARQMRTILIREDLIPHTISEALPMTPVLAVPVNNTDARERIVRQINQEGINPTISSDGVIMVRDENTARRMRAVLIREDLIPAGTDPWQLFNRECWTTTEFERNVNVRRAIQQMITDHIRALEDVEDVWVNIVVPADRLFQAREPVTASVILAPKPESDITQNRKKIEGIQKLLMYVIDELKGEHIIITDQNGLILNDFDGIIPELPEMNVQLV